MDPWFVFILHIINKTGLRPHQIPDGDGADLHEGLIAETHEGTALVLLDPVGNTDGWTEYRRAVLVGRTPDLPPWDGESAGTIPVVITGETTTSPVGVDMEPRPDGFCHVWDPDDGWCSLGWRPVLLDEEEAAIASSPSEVLRILREGGGWGPGVYAVPCGGRQTYYTVS